MTLAPIRPNMYCYDAIGKRQQSLAVRRFYRAAVKQLPEYTFKVHHNPGGIAVWGETYAYIYRDDQPVVEAFDTPMGMLVRQWDGKDSGRNCYVHDLDGFVSHVRALASKPFVRF